MRNVDRDAALDVEEDTQQAATWRELDIHELVYPSPVTTCRSILNVRAHLPAPLRFGATPAPQIKMGETPIKQLFPPKTRWHKPHDGRTPAAARGHKENPSIKAGREGQTAGLSNVRAKIARAPPRQDSRGRPLGTPQRAWVVELHRTLVAQILLTALLRRRQAGEHTGLGPGISIHMPALEARGSSTLP